MTEDRPHYRVTLTFDVTGTPTQVNEAALSVIGKRPFTEGSDTAGFASMAMSDYRFALSTAFGLLEIDRQLAPWLAPLSITLATANPIVVEAIEDVPDQS